MTSVQTERLTLQCWGRLNTQELRDSWSHINIAEMFGIERFMVRTTKAIKTHFFCTIRAFTQLEPMRSEELIENWCEFHRHLSVQVARDFILEHLKNQVRLNAHSQFSVNA